MQGIRIGVGLGVTTEIGSLENALQSFRAAEAAGFHTVWVPNIFARDALTLLALAGRETQTIELGSAVVPTFSRHPLYMAQQALTTQEATTGGDQRSTRARTRPEPQGRRRGSARTFVREARATRA
jgi:alkanesulfonate monooxygenase SsuD/methylene tetrahydromethanopterin reductase-like flavin-dependent oxidoreductase (luciferase family)